MVELTAELLMSTELFEFVEDARCMIICICDHYSYLITQTQLNYCLTCIKKKS
jgi:hypothetical protein